MYDNRQLWNWEASTNTKSIIIIVMRCTHADFISFKIQGSHVTGICRFVVGSQKKNDTILEWH
jgi:hypothetical protein